MQKSLSVAICLFGLSLGAHAKAQELKGDGGFQAASLAHHIQPQNLAVADLAPDNLPEAISPTALVNVDVSHIDPARLGADKTSKSDKFISSRSSDKPANANERNEAISAAEKAQMKNYAPFMRNLMVSAKLMNNSPKMIKASRISRGGKQVIVLGGP